MKRSRIKKRALSFLIGILLIANAAGPAFAQDSLAAASLKNDLEIAGDVLFEPVPAEEQIANAEESSPDFTVTSLELEDYSKIPDRSDDGEDEDENSVSVQAALPDLQMSSVSSTASQPFANVTPIQFHSTVSNIGSASVSTLVFTFYVDDNYETEIQATGTLNPGEQAVLSFYMESKVGGYHSLKIIVNESRSIEESNYNNNTGVGYFQWQACVSISADSITIPFPSTMKDCSIIFNISNKGTLDADDVPVEIDVNGSVLYSMTTDLPAKTAKRGTLTVTFYKSGGYTFALKVDPNRIINDVDRSDNSVSSNITVLPDVETWAGKWADPDDLDVQIYSSGANEIQNSKAGSDALLNAARAIRKWNGYVSGVSYGGITVSDSDEVNIQETPVAMSAAKIVSDDPNTIPLAVTFEYKRGSNGIERIEEEDLESDDSNYVYSVVYLNNEYFDTLEAKDQLRTITHEFGHVLGLAHPICGDVAIMRQSLDSLKSYNIEPHDIFSLEAHY